MGTATAVLRVTVGSGGCEELGRVTRNYVSAYNRSRIHYGQVYASERRCLVTNFNGAIPPGRQIVRAVWDTFDTVPAYMSQSRIASGGREVEVLVSAQTPGQCKIRVDAYLDNGEVYTAWQVLRVVSAPYVGTPQWVNGPKRVEAIA